MVQTMKNKDMTEKPNLKRKHCKSFQKIFKIMKKCAEDIQKCCVFKHFEIKLAGHAVILRKSFQKDEERLKIHVSNLFLNLD